MVFEPQSYISYRFMWLSSCDAGWWDMFGTRYTIFGCYVLSENVSGITPLMISEVDPMENCDSLFSGKQWYFICNWWLLIGIPTNTPSANLSLSPKPSHLLCHPIDSTEVGVQHPAHHLQKPDLFSQGSTAWYWCDKIDFEHITKSRRWTTVHHIAPQKLNIFGCLPHGCRSFACFPKKARPRWLSELVAKLNSFLSVKSTEPLLWTRRNETMNCRSEKWQSESKWPISMGMG